MAGRAWPYSKPFCLCPTRSSKTLIRWRTYISMDGTSIYWPALYIDVNGRRVVHEDYLYSGEQYKWNWTSRWRIEAFSPPCNAGSYTQRRSNTRYTLEVQRVYARKAGESWTCVLDKADGSYELDIDGDYVKFGFEFQIEFGVASRFSTTETAPTTTSITGRPQTSLRC